MSALTKSFVRLVAPAVSAVALLAAMPAQAAPDLAPACAAAQKNTGPLLSDNNAANCYTAGFSRALRAAAKDEIDAGTPAGAFVYNLEKAIRGEPISPNAALTGGVNGASRTLVYPNTKSNELLVFAAVLPPAGHEKEPIKVCVQQSGNVVGAWKITNKGEVIPDAVVNNPAGSNKAACAATIVAARAAFNALPPAQTPAAGGAINSAQKPTTEAASR